MLVQINMPDALPKAGQCPMGQGTRYLVATTGRKYVHLFYPPTLTGWSVTHDQYKALRPREVGPQEVKPRKMAKRIKERQKLFTELQLFDGGKAAARAISTLKAE